MNTVKDEMFLRQSETIGRLQSENESLRSEVVELREALALLIGHAEAVASWTHPEGMARKNIEEAVRRAASVLAKHKG